MKILLIIVISPIIALAQSEFINDNDFGLYTNYGFATNDVMNAYGALFGISVGGKVDFGAEFLTATFNDERSDFNSSSSLLYLGYNIKRKNNSSNLKLLIGYMTTKLDGYSNNQNSGIALGLSFSIRALENENIMLMPTFGIIYGFIESEKRTYLGNLDFRDDNFIQNTRSISLDVNLKLKIIDIMNFIVIPSISKNLNGTENSVSYSISGGILLDFEL